MSKKVARSLSTQEQARERRKIGHSRLDVVSVRLEGHHVFWSCYHHLPQVMADILQGDDTIWLDCCQPPSFDLHKYSCEIDDSYRC